MFKKITATLIALVLVFACLASVASASAADEFVEFEDDWFAPLTSQGALNCKMYTIRGGNLYRGKIGGTTDLKTSKVGFKGTTYETKGGRFSYESGKQLTAVHVTGKIRIGYDWATVIAATDEAFGTHGGHIARRFDDKVTAKSKFIAEFTADGISVEVWEFAPETETEEAIMGYYWTGKKTTTTKKPQKQEDTDFTMQPIDEQHDDDQHEDTDWTISGDDDQGQDDGQDTDWTISGDDDQGQDDGQDTDWTIIATEDTDDGDQGQDTGWTIGGQDSQQDDDQHEDTDFTIGGGNDQQDDHQDNTDFTIGGGNDDTSTSAGTDFSIGGETVQESAPVETIGDGWTIGGGETVQESTPVEEAPTSDDGADTDWSI